MRYLLFTFAIILMSCTSSSDLEVIKLISGDKEMTLHVEIADEPDEQSQGLMNRTELPKGHGMLFVFETPRAVSFWMKNTLIPQDIFFFDESGEYVGFQTMQPCKKDPCEHFLSIQPVKYALEVNAGFEKREWQLTGTPIY